MAPKPRKPKKAIPKFTGAGNGPKNEAQTALHEWLKEMVDWGEKVRVDIIRLEGAAGLATGDPGPPPDEPWLDDPIP